MHFVSQQCVGATVRVQVLAWVTGVVSSSPEFHLPHRIYRQEGLPDGLRPWCENRREPEHLLLGVGPGGSRLLFELGSVKL